MRVEWNLEGINKNNPGHDSKGVHKKNATGIVSVKRQESKNKLIQLSVPRRFEYREESPSSWVKLRTKIVSSEQDFQRAFLVMREVRISLKIAVYFKLHEKNKRTEFPSLWHFETPKSKTHSIWKLSLLGKHTIKIKDKNKQTNKKGDRITPRQGKLTLSSWPKAGGGHYELRFQGLRCLSGCEDSNSVLGWFFMWSSRKMSFLYK